MEQTGLESFSLSTDAFTHTLTTFGWLLTHPIYNIRRDVYSHNITHTNTAMSPGHPIRLDRTYPKYENRYTMQEAAYYSHL